MMVLPNGTSGTREGPQAIIDASPYLELYDMELDQEIHKVGIHTLPAVQPVLGSIEDMLHRVYQSSPRTDQNRISS